MLYNKQRFVWHSERDFFYLLISYAKSSLICMATTMVCLIVYVHLSYCLYYTLESIAIIHTLTRNSILESIEYISMALLQHQNDSRWMNLKRIQTPQHNSFYIISIVRGSNNFFYQPLLLWKPHNII